MNFSALHEKLNQYINKGRLKSPWVVHYDCGSCNGCDIEVLACLTPVFDVERFGIVNIGDPKHADVLLVTGTVNQRNKDVLKNLYDQMPEPKAVIAIGACVADTLVTVPHYPAEDTKLRAAGIKQAGGGPAATGLVAAAKLGCDTAFAGVLADDAAGAFLYEDFARYGVDTTLLRMLSGYRSFTSTVLLAADTATRTCVFDKGTLPPFALTEAHAAAISDAALLMVDGTGGGGGGENRPCARRAGTLRLRRAVRRRGGIARFDRLYDSLPRVCAGAHGQGDRPRSGKGALSHVFPPPCRHHRGQKRRHRL